MINLDSLIDVYNQLEDPNETAEQVYFTLIKDCTADLDSVMQEVYNKIVMSEDYTIEDVQLLFTKLGNYVYFFGQIVEKIGLGSDISEHSFKEVYNNAYNTSLIGADGKKRTANELTAIAEAASLNESVLNDIYKRAYKAIKFKVDSAQSMVATLSKIYSRKIQELQFSKQFDDNKILLS